MDTCKGVISVCSQCQGLVILQHGQCKSQPRSSDNCRLTSPTGVYMGVCVAVCVHICARACVFRLQTPTANVSTRKAQFIKHTLKSNLHCEGLWFGNVKIFLCRVAARDITAWMPGVLTVGSGLPAPCCPAPTSRFASKRLFNLRIF